MDFAREHRSPTKHLIGLSVVILVHVVVIYALVNGLASKVIDVIKQPIETKIIQEVKAPPPPPEIKMPPPPKLVTPPPPFIPPPEVQIQTPPPVQNTITAVSSTPAPQPAVPQPVVAAPVAAKPAAPVNVGVACPNVREAAAQGVYPPRALRAGINSGTVTVRFTVAPDGQIKDVTVANTSNRLFNDAAQGIVSKLKCTGTGSDQLVSWEIGFRAD